MVRRRPDSPTKDVRRRVAARIEELQTNPRRVSLAMGKHAGYVHEWLTGKQKRLPYEVKVMLAKALKMEPRDLGAVEGLEEEAPPGLREWAHPYTPSSSSVLLARPDGAFFVAPDNALDQCEPPIRKGQIVVFDLTRADVDAIPSGAVVVVQCLSREDFTRSEGSLMRIFLRPNKLLTNSTGRNELLSLDDPSLPFEPVIKGLMVGAYDERD